MIESQSTEQDVGFARYPIHKVDRIASKLETLAKILRRNAERFRDERVHPSLVLGDIISEYAHGLGINAYLSDLVSDVEHLRAAREVKSGE